MASDLARIVVLKASNSSAEAEALFLTVEEAKSEATEAVANASELVSLSRFRLKSLGFKGICYDNGYYAKVGGGSTAEMNNMEMKFLFDIHFRLHVPSGLYNISTIIALSVSINQLEGNIPPDIGSTLPNLKFHYLFGNLFTGTLPTSLSNASELELVEFSQNDFSGTMPRDLGKLLGLRYIYIYIFYQNRLRDDFTFISSLTNYTSLQSIDAGNNLLRGSLPDSVANLSTYLSYFNLEINQIHGNILLGIGNLLNLTLVSMAANNLAGPIPSSIGRLHKLQELLLGRNKFTELSSSLGNLTSLIILDLSENNIHGSITPSLGNCHSLLELALSQKNLNGSIPPEIMSLSSISTFLLLNHNALTGSLPSEVGSLTNLGHVDVSYNRLSGPIPNTLRNCLSLEWLQLEANSFEGEIPQSLRMLRGLRLLDLSHNKLSVKMPSYLGELQLDVLNLSFNRLHGEVPIQGVFQNGSAISIVGNNELCGELLKATNGFSEANLIGVGSYASVYKGILDHVHMVVAMKVLNLQTRRASKSFMSECKALRAIRHRNLLKILGVCSSVDFHAEAEALFLTIEEAKSEATEAVANASELVSLSRFRLKSLGFKGICYNNGYYAKVGGGSTAEMNNMEMKFFGGDSGSVDGGSKGIKMMAVFMTIMIMVMKVMIVVVAAATVATT
ncbi:probable LRR receptor-like serine/threonine-protein kinase At3g47570 [Camellia sinensis]|uniref:probable LRR receptor-like serine/threonine-protein kinase At3g47570 n=1 Tax=Camellia sinensis TaxID=4442 RepID=UPI0010363AD9|nr:probable LRR receptor-like serine/threonine-protein kinase At3g47570 [Camellia sinensis]